jgi:hypothetical protein
MLSALLSAWRWRAAAATLHNSGRRRREGVSQAGGVFSSAAGAHRSRQRAETVQSARRVNRGHTADWQARSRHAPAMPCISGGYGTEPSEANAGPSKLPSMSSALRYQRERHTILSAHTECRRLINSAHVVQTAEATRSLKPPATHAGASSRQPWPYHHHTFWDRQYCETAVWPARVTGLATTNLTHNGFTDHGSSTICSTRNSLISLRRL